MNKRATKLKDIHIKKFRGLEDVKMEFGDRITLICGKNGTSKSTILGIVAQIFSFTTDYSVSDPQKNELNKFKTLLGKPYSSKFSEHFRFSERFDVAGSMDVVINLFDGLEKIEKNELQLKLYASQDRSKGRPVLRGNNDRNVTHPVVFLSVGRLIPISQRRKYTSSEDKYIKNNERVTLGYTNKILLQNNTKLTMTTGDVESLVGHNDNYDHESISVGEDNVGQIVRALLSFAKLKEEFSNYAGGILLIDEADAGLFPAAQIEFFKLLRKVSKELDLQVIMTSHSPTLIKEIYNQQDRNSYKNIYLTNSFGSIEVKEDYTWSDINADIHVTTKPVGEGIKLPTINIYFEDNEAYQFFTAILRTQKLRKIINKSKTTLGCKQLLTLKKEKIPEFSTKSIVILDGDEKIGKSNKNFLNLPSDLPPDQLLFEILYNLDDGDSYWRENIYGFSKAVFYRIANETITGIDFERLTTMTLQELIKEYRVVNKGKDVKKIRDQFKNFYKHEVIQACITGPIKWNPFAIWRDANSTSTATFEQEFIKTLKYVLNRGYNVDMSTLNDYFD
ncbi:AAA family ATPase [Listeria newyorkensis]|uniref:ATP-binding protein n=1 Tax=Listeria newyorkensis TaxID=1497681 RepID=A0A841YWR9_9LIST|nr:AAA family ATPase [Listeria newyorkensis]MBC1457850.1 ATP-binding protein [Listeria newyorkensis]